MKKLEPGTYQHYKGHKYLVIGTATHSETLEKMVVYKTLPDNDQSAIWVRPLKMFLEKVFVDGKMVPRFRKISTPSQTTP
ncbi:MAG: DUF1653 domain-containing protein [Candidatus Pacebacteria bacterium CG10_big_fil_rev_8_21_14_0_10_42_12]|nr:MAG: DUF1653 domain-containing protein [Candidatus Pacebacteria bacterium CG10_big_fil_rev_8_21_14_0_10_42_12]